jgi:hypothetical protein
MSDNEMDALYRWTGPFAFLMVAMRETSNMTPRPHAKFLRTQALLVHVATAIYLLAAVSILTPNPHLTVLLGDGLFWTTWTFAVFQTLHHQHNGNTPSFATRITLLGLMGALCLLNTFGRFSGPNTHAWIAFTYLTSMMVLLLEPVYGAEDQGYERARS